MWQRTFRAYLSHKGYSNSEIEDTLTYATEIVNKFPEPMKSRLTRKLDSMSRDSFMGVDFGVLDSLTGVV